jgi:hypothetical protein
MQQLRVGEGWQQGGEHARGPCHSIMAQIWTTVHLPEAFEPGRSGGASPGRPLRRLAKWAGAPGTADADTGPPLGPAARLFNASAGCAASPLRNRHHGIMKWAPDERETY